MRAAVIEPMIVPRQRGTGGVSGAVLTLIDQLVRDLPSYELVRTHLRHMHDPPLPCVCCRASDGSGICECTCGRGWLGSVGRILPADAGQGELP